MEITKMKMTVTLDAAEIRQLVKEHVARELSRPMNTIEEPKINVKLKQEGDQRDSWNVAVFENITVEINGK